MPHLEVIKMAKMADDTFVSDRRLSQEFKVNREDYLDDYDVETFEELSEAKQKKVDLAVEDAKLELEKQANKVRKSILVKRDEVDKKFQEKVPKRPSQEDLQKDHQKKIDVFVSEWEPNFTKIGEELKTFKKVIKTKTHGDINFEYDFKGETDKSIKEVMNNLRNVLFSKSKFQKNGDAMNIEKPTAQEFESSTSLARKSLFLMNEDKILSAFAEELIDLGADGMRKKYTPASIDNPHRKAVGDGKMSDFDKAKKSGRFEAGT
jgi:hypothetical protein